MSEAKKGKPGVRLGIKASEETKIKMSQINKGKTWKLINGKRVWLNKQEDKEKK